MWKFDHRRLVQDMQGESATSHERGRREQVVSSIMRGVGSRFIRKSRGLRGRLTSVVASEERQWSSVVTGVHRCATCEAWHPSCLRVISYVRNLVGLWLNVGS
jgi:hypothetical protein